MFDRSNYFFNPHALPILVIGVIVLGLGFLAYHSNPRNPANRSFLNCCVSTFVWLGGTGLGLLSREPEVALRWFKIDLAGVIFISVSFYAFAMAFLELERRRHLLLAHLLASMLAAIVLFMDFFISGVTRYRWGYYPRWSLWGAPFFLTFFGYMAAAFTLFFRSYRTTSSPLKRTQIKYVLAAFLIAYIGSVDFLPAIGYPIYPFGYIPVFLLVIIIAYAIRRYRLLDISVVINQGVALTVLFAAIFLPSYLIILTSLRATPYSIPPLLAGSMALACGFWVWLKKPGDPTHRTFGLVCLSVSVWLFGAFMSYSSSNEEAAFHWKKADYIGVVYLPAFIYHFVIRFLQRQERKGILFANYFMSTLFALLLPTDYLIAGKYSYFWGTYIRAGALQPLFIAYFAATGVLSLRRLYSGYKRIHETSPLKALRIKYVFWAFVIGFLASIDFLQLYGWEFYPVGFVFIILWALIVGYAVIKYQFMETHLTAENVWGYVRILSLIPLYFLILLLELYFHRSVDYLFAGILLALFTMGAAPIYKARQHVEGAVKQLLFKKAYQADQMLRNFSKVALSILDQEELTGRVVETISTALGIRRISFYVQNSTGDYLLVASAGPGEKEGEGLDINGGGVRTRIIRAGVARPFFSWLEHQERVIEYGELEFESGHESIMPMAKRYFSDVGAKICLPLIHDRKLIGLINLGEKEMLASFTHSDIGFLSKIRAQTSVALSNALQYDGAQQTSQELQLKIEERTRELAESKQALEHSYRKLQELDHLKSRFFANISHELRTPLTLILAPIQSLLAISALPQKAQQQLTIMHQNALRLLRLINNLLDFAKIDAGKMELSYSRLEFCSYLREIVSSVSPLADKKGLSLSLSLSFSSSETSIEFHFDPDKIEKVLLNLIFNAIKFTSSGGRVEIFCTRQEDRVIIRISDTGIGIAKENLTKLFSRFSQIEATSSRLYEGTGIGLALAKELVELHRGEIRVESEPGKGSTFIVDLPYLVEPVYIPVTDRDVDVDWTKSLQRAAEYSTRGIIKEESSHPHHDGDNTLPARPAILLVEDNPDMLQFLATQLQDHYRILAAADGAQGLEQARTHRPALIVSDVMMPVMDGYQLCRKLKADPGTMHIPVILLTAKADLSMKIEGLECGADEYLTKPFSSEELRARIKSLLSLRELEAGLIQSEKMAALGLLVAGVTHEINNPLHFSRINLSNLRRAVERLNEKLNAMAINEADLRPLLEEIPDDVRIVNTGLERIERVVHDLKAFIRKDTEQFVPTDLHEGIDSTLALLRGELGEKIDVVKEYGEIAPVSAVPGQINQVFLNLIQNAIHAIPKERKGKIAIRTWREGEVVKVAIRDNGEGIQPENVRRIFDPFFTTKEVGKGTGLGLWVCNRIMVKHGGSIEVNSEPGAGTEMCLTFPLRKP